MCCQISQPSGQHLCKRFWVQILAHRPSTLTEGFPWFSSVPLGKCKDSSLYHTMKAFFHILPNSFIHQPVDMKQSQLPIALLHKPYINQWIPNLLFYLHKFAQLWSWYRWQQKLVPLTAECQMYEEWKRLMLYVYTLFHKTGQLESASSSIRGKISQLTSRPWPAEWVGSVLRMLLPV